MKKSLRRAINDKCTDCVFDRSAAGTRLAQITLCSCYSCPLWGVRPVTKAPIPQSVLDYYEIEPDDPCLKSILRPGGGRNGPLTELTVRCPQDGISVS